MSLTSFWCSCNLCNLWTEFKPFTNVSVVDFEQAVVGCDIYMEILIEIAFFYPILIKNFQVFSYTFCSLISKLIRYYFLLFVIPVAIPFVGSY